MLIKAGRVAPPVEANMTSGYFRPSKSVGVPRKSAAEPKLTRRSKVEPRLTKNAPLVDFTKPTRFSNDWMNVTKTLGKSKNAYSIWCSRPRKYSTYSPIHITHNASWFLIWRGRWWCESDCNYNSDEPPTMSFSLATGIKLILPIKTVAYDQRSSVSRIRKDFKSLFSHWLSNQNRYKIM